MALDTITPRSRRALLGAAVGAAAATVASALGRPAPARAGTDGDVILGEYNPSGRTTTVAATQVTGLVGSSQQGYGLLGQSTSVAGVRGESAADGVSGSSSGATKSGVYGVNSNAEGYGVFGRNSYGTATGYLGGAGIGAHGESDSWIGVLGSTTSGGWGVVGGSDAGGGVFGMSGPVVWAQGQPENTGVCGIAANDATSVGVRGHSPAGTGGHFSSSTGTALRVDGKARFSRSKRVTIGAGKSSLKVTLAGVTSSSLVFAVLHSNRSGTYVRAIVPTSGSFTIYLNRAVTASTYVAYFVLN